jgi:hypothetical protein
MSLSKLNIHVTITDISQAATAKLTLSEKMKVMHAIKIEDK